MRDQLRPTKNVCTSCGHNFLGTSSICRDCLPYTASLCEGCGISFMVTKKKKLCYVCAQIGARKVSVSIEDAEWEV